MNSKKVFGYITFSALVYGLFIGGELLLDHLRKVYSVTYEGIFWMLGVMILAPMIIGLLLGIENFLLAIPEQKGLWKVHWYRLLVVGLPAFIIIVNFVLSFLGFSTPMYQFSNWPILIAPEFIMSISLILGYILGSSFFRDNGLLNRVKE